MREIKFRAWDKVDHIWYKENPNLSRMIYFANPKVFDYGWLQFESVGQDPIGDSGEDRFELMLYTGLHDRNGKEIYEGDICKRAYVAELPYAVEWIDTGFFWSDGDMLDPTEDCEVIGNIKENLELLNI